ncbi:MAG TPA: FMN-binding protein [Firmicutes bacterium]|nr:FMN-binding protein [Bacillota bacterium]
MKKVLSTVALAAVLLVGCSSSAKYTDGTYTGNAEGLKGPIDVEVTIKDGSISDVVILENQETETIFASIEEYLIPDIIKANSADIDTLAGATTSSAAVLDAVNVALDSAK